MVFILGLFEPCYLTNFEQSQIKFNFYFRRKRMSIQIGDAAPDFALINTDGEKVSLSDFNKEAAPKYDSLYDIFLPGKYNYIGVAKRSAFVIGKDGKIKYMEICPSSGDQPSYEKIKNSLQ